MFVHLVGGYLLLLGGHRCPKFSAWAASAHETTQDAAETTKRCRPFDRDPTATWNSPTTLSVVVDCTGNGVTKTIKPPNKQYVPPYRFYLHLKILDLLHVPRIAIDEHTFPVAQLQQLIFDEFVYGMLRHHFAVAYRGLNGVVFGVGLWVRVCDRPNQPADAIYKQN